MGLHRVLGSGLLRVSTAPAWWYVAGKTCVAAYQPKGAASLAASYVNLAQPGTYNAAPGVAPTFDAATGWTFAGAQYLNTGVVPAKDHTWSMLVRFSGAERAWTAWRVMAGQQSWTGAYSFSLGVWHLDTLRGRHGGLKEWTNAAVQGVFAMSASAGYLDGLLLSGAIPAGTADTVYSIYIGAENYNNTAGRKYIGAVQAVAIYSATLTAGEVAVLSAAMAAL